MPVPTGKDRVFLFLQGPHGPFFNRLGQMLRQSGAKVWRAGFNAGDQFFWSDKSSYIAYTGAPEDWPAAFEAVFDDAMVLLPNGLATQNCILI